MYIRNFTEEEKQFIIEKYINNKWTAAKIGKELKAGVATVRKFLHKKNLIRSVGSTSRKYSSNFSYFESIDTEHKAYWLGVLYADGCVSKKNNSLRFSSIDKEWIETFLPFAEEIAQNCDSINTYGLKSAADFKKEICKILDFVLPF